VKKFESIYGRLLSYSDGIKIIDTHEHLHPYKNYLGDEPDVLCDYFSHYITTDLQSVGMTGSDLNEVKDYKLDLEERFKILKPCLEQVKNTSYYRVLEIAAKKVHRGKWNYH
jgi:hypothetical protein